MGRKYHNVQTAVHFDLTGIHASLMAVTNNRIPNLIRKSIVDHYQISCSQLPAISVVLLGKPALQGSFQCQVGGESCLHCSKTITIGPEAHCNSSIASTYNKLGDLMWRLLKP